ncbi:MAG: adenylate/guanylate cyclase domain-containing protein, partial [bacterium]
MFCNECGASVIPLCPACERENPPGSKYCNGCGHDFSKPTASPVAAPTTSTTTEGERRQATVLFSDLSGYTAMNERLDPEEVTIIMGHFKEAAERIVAAHGGTVNQFVGDEVFALFGIPTAHEDDPQRAVRAALELHEAVRALSDDIEARLGETLRLHSGINTGLVVTSPGDGTGGRYDVTGDAINTAARLVAQAEANEILVSPDTRRLITPYFDLEALDPVALKGKAKPMAPYRVVGRSGVQSRFEAAEVTGLTQFTGREVELEQLHSALSKAIAGQGQVITISGEAGLGKSRLAYEFRHGIDREQCAVL